MKNFLTAFAFIAASAVLAFGQNAAEKTSVCTNETAEKISSREIKIGADINDVLNLFAENGNLTTVSAAYAQDSGQTLVATREIEFQNLKNFLEKQSTNTFGFAATSLAPKDKIKFDGVARYDLGFLDNRLAFFRTYYTKPIWENNEQFIDKMSEILNLPKQKYYEGNAYRIKCGQYTIEFSQFGQSQNDGARAAMLVTADVDETLRARRKKADDLQREKDIKTFKP